MWCFFCGCDCWSGIRLRCGGKKNAEVTVDEMIKMESTGLVWKGDQGGMQRLSWVHTVVLMSAGKYAITSCSSYASRRTSALLKARSCPR
jgi:hypothetical protein